MESDKNCLFLCYGKVMTTRISTEKMNTVLPYVTALGNISVSDAGCCICKTERIAKIEYSFGNLKIWLLSLSGLARQYTANHLIHKGLAAVFLLLSALLVRENHIMHTVSPPCGNALAETFIYPRNRVTHINAVPAGFRGFLYPTANR